MTTNVSVLKACVARGWELVRKTPGYLSQREAECIMALIAASPATGANVEIGSFKGRSTVGLAYVASSLELGSVTAIDPHTSPSSTDPDLRGAATTFDDFMQNLRNAGVEGAVDARRDFSGNVAKGWRDPIRFLWIDGDHTYDGALADIEMFKPFLAEGAIVAMHDVLGTFEGSLRVFVEEILDSDDFGPAGFSGSIGWAQYRPRDGRKFRIRRKLLALPARRLIPIAAAGGLIGWNKYVYKLWRPLAPHGDVNMDGLERLLKLER